MSLRTTSRLIQRARRHSEMARMFQTDDGNQKTVSIANTTQPTGRWQLLPLAVPITSSPNEGALPNVTAPDFKFADETLIQSVDSVNTDGMPTAFSTIGQQGASIESIHASTTRRTTEHSQPSLASSVATLQRQAVMYGSATPANTLPVGSGRRTASYSEAESSDTANETEPLNRATSSPEQSSGVMHGSTERQTQPASRVMLPTNISSVQRAAIQTSTPAAPLPVSGIQSGATQGKLTPSVSSSNTNLDQPIDVQRQTLSVTAQVAEQQGRVQRPIGQPAPTQSSADADWNRLQRILHLHQQREAREEQSITPTVPSQERGVHSENAKEAVTTQPAVRAAGNANQAIQRQAKTQEMALRGELPVVAEGAHKGLGDQPANPVLQRADLHAAEDSIGTNADIVQTDATDLRVETNRGENSITPQSAQTQPGAPSEHSAPATKPLATSGNSLQRSSLESSLQPGQHNAEMVKKAAEPVEVSKKPLVIGNVASAESDEHPSISQFAWQDDLSEVSEGNGEEEASTQSVAASASNSVQSLEQVWPVQRAALSDVGDSANGEDIQQANEVSDPEVPPALPYDAVLSQEEAHQLRTRLNSTPTVQRTESTVDIVLPRRPRPMKQGMPSIATQEDSTTASVQQVSSPVQRTKQAPANATETTITGTESSAENVFRQNNAAESELVETAIGPLPSDLWRLIGDKPPLQTTPSAQSQSNQPRDSHSPSVDSSSSIIQSQSPVQRQENRVEQESAKSLPVGQIVQESGKEPYQENQAIQNDWEIIPQNQTNANGQADSSTTGENQLLVQMPKANVQKKTNETRPAILMRERVSPPAGNDQATLSTVSNATDKQTQTDTPVNIESLAQQVYGHLKRRLIVERERLHLQ